MSSFALTVLAMVFSLEAHAQDQLAPPKIVTSSPTGVNLADGSFSTSNVDLELGTLKLTRSYSSAPETSNHYFSGGWTHNFDIWVRQNYIHSEDTVDVVIGRIAHHFSGTISQNYPGNDDIGTVLTTVGGVTTFIDRDGTTYRFLSLSNGYAKGSQIVYPSGEVIDISYAGNAPRTIVSSMGYALLFDYTGGNISAACAVDLASTAITTGSTCAASSYTVRYYYNASKLATYQDLQGKITSYLYDSNALLSCITIPGKSSCRIVNTYIGNIHGVPPRYNATDVSQQTLADGSVWKYSCSCGSGLMIDPEDPNPEDDMTVTEPNGATYSWAFLRGNEPYVNTDENGHQTLYSFAGSLPLSVQYPEGNKVTWAYSIRQADGGNSFVPKQGSNQSTITTSRSYPSSCSNYITCNEPTTVTDANGGVTEFTYDPNNGGVASEMRPAPSSGAARPLRLHTYVQKYAYIVGPGGGLVPGSSPVWMPASDTECQTAAGSNVASCDSSAPQKVTTYEYGTDGTADNLLLRGKVVSSSGVSYRSCFGYDQYSNRSSETSPRAGLASCS